MTQIAVFAVALAAFAAIYLFLKNQPNWSRGGGGTPYGSPGWWKPMAAGFFVVLVLFVAYAAMEHGFKWRMLLVFPILGGAFALGVLLLKTVGRRAGR